MACLWPQSRHLCGHLLFQVAISTVILSSHSSQALDHTSHSEGACEDQTSAERPVPRVVASNLLQVRSGPSDSHIVPSPAGSGSPTGPRGMRRADEKIRTVAIMTAPEPVNKTSPPVNKTSASKDILPKHLFELGRELLGSEAALDKLVAGSRLENITYAGVQLTMRLLNGDMSNASIAGEDDQNYNLETLRETSASGMLNVLDLGGNYGTLSIAAFKKFSNELRVVIVEPIPSIYFLLRWNMWLNSVPELHPDFSTKANVSGVMALNRGLTESDGKTVGFCHAPPNSINAFACDCHQNSKNSPEECMKVTGISMQSLLDMFALEPIALMKLDCEGCEAISLPAMVNITKETPGRVRRLAGELHAPTQEIENIACQYDNGARFVKICLSADGHYQGGPLRCDERSQCDNEMPFLEQLRLLHFTN